MFSGALAGALRVGAVLVTTGAMAGGVYFVVQVGERNDATQFQAQATATAAAGEQLSPPNQIGAPLSPPNQIGEPPDPIPTPPAIDTSDWLTYESPLGFTIKYPPGWVVEEESPSEQGVRWTSIRSPRPEPADEIVIEGGNISLPRGASIASIEIAPLPDSWNSTDLDQLVAACRPGDSAEFERRQGIRTTFAGLPAVRCFGDKHDRSGLHFVTVDIYYVVLPAGNMFEVIASAVDSPQTELAEIQAALATALNTGSPQ